MGMTDRPWHSASDNGYYCSVWGPFEHSFHFSKWGASLLREPRDVVAASNASPTSIVEDIGATALWMASR